jgi:hypothetical protein
VLFGGSDTGRVLTVKDTGPGWAAIPAPPASWARWTGTQAEYDALATKDPDTLYVITP